MTEIIFQLVLLTIAVEAITELIVAAKITNGTRSKIRKLAHPMADEYNPPQPPDRKRKCWIFLNDIVSCGYCTSVWVAGGIAPFAPWVYRFDGGWWLVDITSWVVNWCLAAVILHRLSNWFHVCYTILMKGRVKTYDIKLDASSFEYNVRVDHGKSGQRSD